jgi:DNA-binding NarL/FixJ family response regulator
VLKHGDAFLAVTGGIYIKFFAGQQRENRQVIGMGENRNPINESRRLFNKISNLQRFITSNEERFSSLTEREVEVLTHIAAGKKNTVIAGHLNISRTTVQNHRTSIRRKLSITSQAGYVKYALAFGLVKF